MLKGMEFALLGVSTLVLLGLLLLPKRPHKDDQSVSAPPKK